MLLHGLNTNRHPLTAVALTLLILLVLVPAPGEASKRTGASGKQGRALADLVELGRRLFVDPVVSRTGHRACASCHDPNHGFSDTSRVSEDDVGVTVRHPQTLINVMHSPNMHWDGEFNSIEDLVRFRIGLPWIPTTGYGSSTPKVRPLSALHDAMGLPAENGRSAASRSVAASKLKERLQQLPRAQDVLRDGARYNEAFQAVFSGMGITRPRMAKALGAYCRSVKSGPAPFDHRSDDRNSLWSPAAERGYALFRGRAGCVKCHTDRKGDAKSATHALFTDYGFHNTGIAWLDASLKATKESPVRRMNKLDQRRHRVAAEASAPTRSARPGFHDPGRRRVSGKGSDVRSFKTPTLRDVARRGPYMHNGMFPTLHDVVRYYASGGSTDPKQDPRVTGFKASEQDIQDLVAFLHALTSEQRPGTAMSRCRFRRKKTTLRFVDAAGAPLSALPVSLIPVGDDLPRETGVDRDHVRKLITSHDGRITFAPAKTTHIRLSLDATWPPPAFGSLIPDSCGMATVRVPARGWVTMELELHGPSARAPASVRAFHVDEEVFAGHERPSTNFQRVRVARVNDVTVARYRARFRTDVSPRVEIHVPGLARAYPALLAMGKTVKIDSRRKRVRK